MAGPTPTLIGIPWDANSSFMRGAAGVRPAPGGSVYVSIDLDGLDPAFAPGVAHREPGGLSVRDVIGLVQALPSRPVGADIVEFNPRQDPAGVTAHVAARLLKELAGTMLDSGAPRA